MKLSMTRGLLLGIAVGAALAWWCQHKEAGVWPCYVTGAGG